MRVLVGQEYQEGKRVERQAGRRPGQGERLTEAVLALAVCHIVTPVYEAAEDGEGSLPESDQVPGIQSEKLPLPVQISGS